MKEYRSNIEIKFTVVDYFEELQLIETQYAQEEDLYPWIYMLLQMAEYQKRVQLEKQYRPISIRDVHKAERFNDNPLKRLLNLKQGPPDIAILSRDSAPKTLRFLGCVEIKKIATHLEINIDENSSFQEFKKIEKLCPKEQTLQYAFYPKILANSLKSWSTIEDKLKSAEKPSIPEIDDPVIAKIKENLNGHSDLCVSLKLQQNRKLPKRNGERTYGLRSYEAILSLNNSNEKEF